MATKKTPGILGRMKDAVAGMFSSEAGRKSAKRVAAGEKTTTVAKAGQAVTAPRKAAKKTARKAAAPGKKFGAKKAR